ncbi:hypothetical protein FIU88_08395 [Halomonas sp. THAF12]|uniref:hypothetical protein n=1 Tax=Halomonas sp. THAF12 TaxID=2587849 RepID=UPI0012A82301|nr:hypothetical protein [Halomonas sp. THAF12]QFT84994.1 hypothetical protein FIU88_08395 [Halomonas sp. THAF12]
MSMTDAILYVPDYPALVTHLGAEYPALLVRDEAGEIAQPPVVTGFARTPAATTTDGSALLVYARLRPAEIEQWRGMPHVTVLAEAPYQGKGTAQAVYGQVFADADALASYDSVYDRTPREVPTGEESITLVADPAFTEPTEVTIDVDGQSRAVTLTDTAELVVPEGAEVVPSHAAVSIAGREAMTTAVTPPAWFGILAGA